jgi:diguanylate cyclase (GGDEF)-like protein/PAS domain S-box-containing protein
VTKAVRVLVVDDSDDDAELVVRELRRAGWATEHERVDKQASLVDAIRERQWDLVVADYSLPQLDALQTLAVIAEHRPDVPCVVVSGRTGEEAAVETMQRGARDYVVKDRLGRLGPVVERVLADAEERREKEATERALRELEQRFHAVVDTAMDAVVTVDANGTIETFNPAAERLFGHPATEAVGRHVDTLLSGPHTDEVGSHFEHVGRHKHGPTFPIEVSRSVARVGDRQIFTWIARDIRERKAFEAHLAEQALRDPLTGVANRTLLVDRIASTQSRASRRPASAALLFLDLDRFKAINDRYGHSAGDEVLRVVAKRLTALVRPADTIARLGGDEFVVLCEDIDGVAGAELIATRIAVAMQSPVLVSGADVVVSVSIGIAVIDDATLDAETLLRDADAAMYRAKERGRDRFEIFDHEMRAQAFARVQVEHALQGALERDQLRLHYQPQRSLTTGELVGFEALLRWEHPQRGLLPPAEFLPIADETGLIVPMGAWAIAEATREATRFTQDEAPITMWVNLSARQLVHVDLVANVAAAVRDAGPHVTLGIEITEDALMSDPGTAIAATRRLRDLGVRLAIDDFGTGYSSLHYVKLFPVDTLKIDRSFVQDVAGDPQDAAIISAIVGLSRALGLEVIAEGVEGGDQASALRELGCDVAQGYHYGRPLTGADVIDVLRREPASALRSRAR